MRWIVAALALLLAGALTGTARAAARGGLQQSLAPYVSGFVPGVPVQAAVVLQRVDCRGNMRMLDLFNRADVRDRLHLSVIWFVGPSTDSAAIRALLPSWTRTVALRRAPRRALAELRQLGHRSTPMMVVFDQEGRVRLATQSPRSAREFGGLKQIVSGLTWIEEL